MRQRRESALSKTKALVDRFRAWLDGRDVAPAGVDAEPSNEPLDDAAAASAAVAALGHGTATAGGVALVGLGVLRDLNSR